MTMATFDKRLPKKVEDRIAEIGSVKNARRRHYKTAGMSEPEIEALENDIAADNADVRAHLEREARGEDPFFDDGRPLPSWESRSAWARSPWKDDIVIELIRLSKWHFRETGNPLFAFRALDIGRYLSVDHAEHLKWANDYLIAATTALMERIDNPAKGQPPPVSLAQALGFPVKNNYNPFREARGRLMNQTIYAKVEEILAKGLPVTGENGAFLIVANDIGLGWEAVRNVYYDMRALVKRDPDTLNNNNDDTSVVLNQ